MSSKNKRIFVIPTTIVKIDGKLKMGHKMDEDEMNSEPEPRRRKSSDIFSFNRKSKSNFVHKLIDKDYPLGAKIIWLIIVILCLVLTLIQVANTISLYLAEPITVTVQIIRNDSLKLPKVTICGKAKFAEKKTKIWANELAKKKKHVLPTTITFDETLNYLIDEYGVEEVWKNTSYNVPEMLQKCNIYHKASCSEFGKWTPVFTFYGLCYSYRLDTKILSAGPYQALYITLKPDDEIDVEKQGWKILVHQWNVNPDLLIQTEGFTLNPNTRADVVMDYHQFESLSTSSKPCNGSANYSITSCEASCVYGLLVKKFGCRLPYMDHFNAPLCRNSSIYNAIYEQQDRILEDGMDSLSHICKCPRPCQENVYKMKLDLRLWPGDQRTILKVYFDDLNYERVEEHLAYGIVQLLSDIGGNLGLFLGVCVVSIFEVGEVIMCKMIKIIRQLVRRNH
ncbi:hypothetical protein CHUAL_002616 [Chamberlinius hualienensis]